MSKKNIGRIAQIIGPVIDVVFDKLIEKLDTFVHGICFIILDEIDILVKKTGIKEKTTARTTNARFFII